MTPPTTWFDVLIQVIITGGAVLVAYVGRKVYKAKKERGDEPDAVEGDLLQQLKVADPGNPMLIVLEQQERANTQVASDLRAANAEIARLNGVTGGQAAEIEALRALVSELRSDNRQLEARLNRMGG